MSYCDSGHATAINKLSKALAECLALQQLDIAIVGLDFGYDLPDTFVCIDMRMRVVLVAL
jgi:hypothetical protein